MKIEKDTRPNYGTRLQYTVSENGENRILFWIPGRQYRITLGNKWLKPGEFVRPSYANPGAMVTEYVSREYGFCTSDDVFFIYYGLQSEDTNMTNRAVKIFSIPWRQTRRVVDEYYNADWTFHQSVHDDGGRINFNGIEAARNTVSRAKFRFKDFDGVENTVSVYFNKMVWEYGSGLFKWVKFLKAPFVRVRMEMEFEKDVGRGKGNWKGGLVACGFDVEFGEDAETAFKRFATSPMYQKHFGNVPNDFTDIERIE
jgi:hypothetical protein